jgi:hypothetical protein
MGFPDAIRMHAAPFILALQQFIGKNRLSSVILCNSCRTGGCCVTNKGGCANESKKHSFNVLEITAGFYSVSNVSVMGIT